MSNLRKGSFALFCSSSVLCRVYPCILFRPQRKEKKKWTTSKPKARTWNPTCPASSTSSAASTRPPASPAPPRESPAPGRPGQTNPAPLLFPAFVPSSAFTMSWQSYVDDQLLSTKMVKHAVICGHDGNIWATSPNFSVSHRGVAGIIHAFRSPPPCGPPCQFPFSRLSSAPPTSATSEPRSCGGALCPRPRSVHPSMLRKGSPQSQCQILSQCEGSVHYFFIL